MLSYLKTEKPPTTPSPSPPLCIASGIGIFATYNWGKATDQVGADRIYLFGTTVMVIFAFPLFLLVNTGIAILIVIDVSSLSSSSEELPDRRPRRLVRRAVQRHTRSSGASIAEQFSAGVSGFTRSSSPCSTPPSAGSAPPRSSVLRPYRPDHRPGHQGNLRSGRTRRRRTERRKHAGRRLTRRNHPKGPWEQLPRSLPGLVLTPLRFLICGIVRLACVVSSSVGHAVVWPGVVVISPAFRGQLDRSPAESQE